MKKAGKKAFAVWLAALLLLVAGCGGGGNRKASADSSSGMANFGGGEASSGTLPTDQESSGRSDSSVYQNAGAKLIRRAELSIQTTQFDQAVQALDGLVLANGGYYESASVYGGSLRDVNADRSGEYIIRIPSERFTAFQSSAGELGYVTSSTQNSEDVGEAYFDTEARLKTQRTKQARLLGLLEQATTMEDIIALESALSDAEYEIEQLSSTLNRYDALIAYATFRVYLSEVIQVSEKVGETASLGEKMAAGFAASGQGMVRGFQNLLVWLSYHIFSLLILAFAVAVGAAFGVRRWRQEKKYRETEDKKKD